MSQLDPNIQRVVLEGIMQHFDKLQPHQQDRFIDLALGAGQTAPKSKGLPLPTREELPNVLKPWRVAFSISQKEMAQGSGVKEETLRKIERGHVPSAPTHQKVVQFLDKLAN